MLESQKNRLIASLQKQGYLKTESIISAFQTIPREKFVPEYQREHAYIDCPLEIGHHQTISAPHMVAIMCEALDIKEGQNILEIGTGAGYHAAIVSTLVGKKGHVYTIERYEELAHTATTNLQTLTIKNVTVVTGDGSLGLPNHKPYDRIYVTCAAPSTPPPLLDQLVDGGKLLIPIGDMFCDLQFITKTASAMQTISICGCAFVPLVGKYGY